MLEAVRAREGEEGFAACYHQRAGIEGTLSAGVPALHLRCIRSVGLAKAHLQPVLTAAAMNLVCLDSSLGGEPFARVRHSPFARLMAQPACA